MAEKYTVSPIENTTDKLAIKIANLVIRGEIDPSKVKSIEKNIGVKLNLSNEQLTWATLVYENRQQYK